MGLGRRASRGRNRSIVDETEKMRSQLGEEELVVVRQPRREA